MLAFPDWQREFVLQTEASTTAVGGILSQRNDEGEEHPIAYFSSGLTEAQKKYSSGELECWAVIATTRKFSKYLRAATHVKIQTDHNPLVWLRKQRDPRGKFTRWILELESINYSIEYIKGTENASAGYLSREKSETDSEVNDEHQCFERHIYVESSSLHEELAKAQRDDFAISSAKSQLEMMQKIDQGPFRSHSGMKILGALLYRGRKVIVPCVVGSSWISVLGGRHLLHRFKCITFSLPFLNLSLTFGPLLDNQDMVPQNIACEL